MEEETKQESITRIEILKKVVVCLAEKCPFNLTQISTQCNLCHHKKEYIINSEVRPLSIKVTLESEYVCYKHKTLPGYQECVFGKQKIDENCSHCGRFTRKKILSDKTEAL